MQYDAPEAFVVRDCLIHTKAEQRREEKFMKIWASVDLQWVEGHWSGFVLIEYSDWELLTNTFSCYYDFKEPVFK